ncbi:lipocalin-like domain-containing protein [Moheibacter sediminis]|uniref:Lipocalin-like domain-containing protein n=1 Tax=Moheibacter sediminis TaxID=1434700 RepID=A0A1W1ZRR9_9FLAO|nr:lipocalin family protein [Moheibacter sediminis]SMC51220.1 Lipocalin-like domain-containing protein [Moheibacter sediminis]
MKKLMFVVPVLLMGLFSMSCSNDDEGGNNNNVDVIVGAWKISSIIVDDTDIYPILVFQGVCEIETVSHFYNDYSVVNKTFQENAEGDCEAGPDDNGTWSREGNVYTITINQTPTSAELNFSDNNNKFTTEQQFEGQTARVTFSRQ